MKPKLDYQNRLSSPIPEIGFYDNYITCLQYHCCVLYQHL
jgi:hypothetical protein